MNLKDFSPRIAFEKNLVCMRICGMQPSKRFSRWFQMYSFIIFIACLCPIPPLTVYNILISEPEKRLQILQDAHIVAEIAAQAIKALSFRKNREIIKKKIIEAWERDIFNTHTELDVKFIQSSFFEYNVIFWVFVGSLVISIPGLLLQQVVSPVRKLPYMIWMPFDALTDRNVYIFVSIYLHIAITFIAVATTAVDTMIAGLMMHTATQLRIVKNRLQYMDEYVEEDMKKVSLELDSSQREALRNKFIYERISRCIELREAVVMYAQDVEDILSVPVFTQFFVHVVVLSVLIVRLVKLNIMSYDFVILFYLFVPFLTQLLLNCYYGTILAEESLTVRDAIFMSNWYNYDEKSKKLLLTLMEQSKKSVQLTAGKILDISLDTFVLVLKRTSSLFAVLKNY